MLTIKTYLDIEHPMIAIDPFEVGYSDSKKIEQAKSGLCFPSLIKSIESFEFSIAYLTSNNEWVAEGHWSVKISGDTVSLHHVNITHDFYIYLHLPSLETTENHYDLERGRYSETKGLAIGGYSINNEKKSFDSYRNFYYTTSSFKKYEAQDLRSGLKKFIDVFGNSNYEAYRKIDVGRHGGNECIVTIIFIPSYFASYKREIHFHPRHG